VEQEHVLAGLGRLESAQLAAAFDRTRIAAGRQHDAECVAGVEAGAHSPEHAVGGAQQELAEIGHEPRQHDLAFGIAHTDIVLDQARARAADHQPGIEDSAEGRALARHGGERGTYDLVHRPLHERGRERWGRRAGAHATGVRPPIAVEGPFVVLRGAEQEGVATVA
jgi:hypothetical protein